MYSGEGRKEEQNGNNSLLIDYNKMQSKFKKVAVFLVSANNKETELVIKKYGKLYRDNMSNIRNNKPLIVNMDMPQNS